MSGRNLKCAKAGFLSWALKIRSKKHAVISTNYMSAFWSAIDNYIYKFIMAVFPNINTNLFNVIERIVVVLYSKRSVTYLKNCGKCVAENRLCWIQDSLFVLGFFFSKGQGQTFITLFSKKGVSDNAMSRFVQFQTVNVFVILKCLSLSKYRHAS